MWQEMKTLRRGRCVCGAGKARAYWRKAHTATLGRRTPPKPSNGHRQVAVQRFFSRNRYKWIAKGQPNLHTNLETTEIFACLAKTATSKRVQFGIQLLCSEEKYFLHLGIRWGKMFTEGPTGGRRTGCF